MNDIITLKYYDTVLVSGVPQRTNEIVKDCFCEMSQLTINQRLQIENNGLKQIFKCKINNENYNNSLKECIYKHVKYDLVSLDRHNYDDRITLLLREHKL